MGSLILVTMLLLISTLLIASFNLALEDGANGSCCESITLSSGGMGDFYQSAKSVWMVGPNVGEDFGGILNRDAGECPESLSMEWEYHRDWTDSWEADWTLEASCGNSGPTPDPEAEPCTWGHYCDNCDIWSEANGVRYCCATDCNSGSLDVSTSNGEVVCTCHHK